MSLDLTRGHPSSPRESSVTCAVPELLMGQCACIQHPDFDFEDENPDLMFLTLEERVEILQKLCMNEGTDDILQAYMTIPPGESWTYTQHPPSPNLS